MRAYSNRAYNGFAGVTSEKFGGTATSVFGFVHIASLPALSRQLCPGTTPERFNLWRRSRRALAPLINIFSKAVYRDPHTRDRCRRSDHLYKPDYGISFRGEVTKVYCDTSCRIGDNCNPENDRLQGIPNSLHIFLHIGTGW